MHFWAEKRSPIELSGSVAVSTANAFRFVLVSAEQLIDDACDQALLLGGADRVLRCLHFLGLLGPAAERLDRHSAGTAYACRFRFGLCGPTAERGDGCAACAAQADVLVFLLCRHFLSLLFGMPVVGPVRAGHSTISEAGLLPAIVGGHCPL